jgi:Fur family ferric uptake transcriptional regulator
MTTSNGQAPSTQVPSTRALRATRQRAAVSTLLDRLDDFRSAQEIHEELRRIGEGIGLTTVYRRCTTADHHHHLVCRRCGHTVEIEGPAVETWAQRVAEIHGFVELSHTAEIFGLCKDCGVR